MKDLWTHIQELSDLDGISGREEAVRAYIEEELAQSPAHISTHVDAIGNLFATVTGAQRAHTRVAFAAHTDEVGFMVLDITDEGYLRIGAVGGIDDAVLCGRRVRVNGRVGVIGTKAIHQCDGDERKKAPALSAMLVDIGTDSKEETAQYVRMGDAVAFDTAYRAYGDNRIIGKALDDRAGCALLLELVRDIPPYDITLVFTVQEEIGTRGAAVAAHQLESDIVVVVEATTAADIADTPKADAVCCQQDGAVVSFMDGRTLYPHDLYARVRAIADARGIKTQTKTRIAGGNDASAFQTAGSGAAVTAVSLPCRYLHSPSCVLHRDDVVAARDALCALAEELPR